MKKVLSLALALAMTFSLLAFSGYALNSDNRAMSNEANYPSNKGEWGIDYLNDLYTKYGVLKESELSAYADEDGYTTRGDAIKLLARTRFLCENPTKSIDDMTSDYLDYAIEIGMIKSKDLALNEPLSRAEFADLLVKSVDLGTIYQLNNITFGDIPDVNITTDYYDSIYVAYRYGLFCGGDADGTFYPNRNLTTINLLVVSNRIMNANLRALLSFYGDDKIEIKSDAFPMSYTNPDKKMEITVTEERYQDTTCYVAHVIVENPCHIKSIYSDLEWSNTGLEGSTMHTYMNPILMINGDFRKPDASEGKGIVRNNQIVNDADFNGVMGIKLDGTLCEVRATSAQEVLDMGIRDTFTFGPALVRNGKVLNLGDETRHPRTFIGQVERTDGLLEYYLVVCEGRTEGESGLTCKDMGKFLVERGCKFGYNLDGGGSSVMVFNGKVLNTSTYGQRANVDYLYIK